MLQLLADLGLCHGHSDAKELAGARGDDLAGLAIHHISVIAAAFVSTVPLRKQWKHHNSKRMHKVSKHRVGPVTPSYGMVGGLIKLKSYACTVQVEHAHMQENTCKHNTVSQAVCDAR